MKRYTPDLQFGGSGDCPAAYMEDDDSGDYVEYQPWMETVTEGELVELRKDRERLEWMIANSASASDVPDHAGEYAVLFGFGTWVHTSCPREAIDRARGVK